LAGLGISYALSVTQSLNWSVRMASDMEASMVAVERVEEYTQIKSEAPRKTPVDETLANPWPRQGEVVFNRAKLRYRQGLPLVLKGLEITIKGGSKVGVSFLLPFYAVSLYCLSRSLLFHNRLSEEPEREVSIVII
jgi:ATP-binding cassette, subfamily C (CFTR/MRP), member 1